MLYNSWTQAYNLRTDREIALLCEWLQLAEVSSFLLQFPEFDQLTLEILNGLMKIFGPTSKEFAMTLTHFKMFSLYCVR